MSPELCEYIRIVSCQCVMSTAETVCCVYSDIAEIQLHVYLYNHNEPTTMGQVFIPQACMDYTELYIYIKYLSISVLSCYATNQMNL